MPEDAPPHAAAVTTPPKAERRPVELRAHGDVRIDDWHWLRDKDDPSVIAYLEAENAYTAAAMAHTNVLQEQLYEEIVARIQETDLSVPVRKGPWHYYHRTVEGENYAVHCRKGVGGGDEQVLLDENLLAAGHDYFALGNLAVSPDQGWLAYSVDTSGGERFVLRFRDLATGAEAPESIDDTTYSLAWANDNATVFYVRVDESMRPYQLWRHTIGTDPSGDVRVHEEGDERFYLGVGRTKDDAYILMDLQSKVTSEVRVLDADDPTGSFRVFAPRRQGVEYSIEHQRPPRSSTTIGEPTDGEGSQGRFLVVTNDDAENFRLLSAPIDSRGTEDWQELLPHRDDVRLEGIDVFADFDAIYERIDGEARIRVVRHSDGSSTPVTTPESPSTAWGGANPEYDATVLRYEYTSLVTPRSVYDLDMDGGQATLRKRQPVLGNFDPGDYRTERLWAVADDGTRVPLSLVFRADHFDGSSPPRAGGAPCLLYGYGSYEASMDPAFSSLRLSLLDQGFVFAIAHVRGGGELGRRWYEEGKLLAKPNTFTDFVACARHLVAEGWTDPDRLVARGGSAGGLLVGAVANLAPELFRAIVAEVPFVDCLTTILDDSLPLTVLEWEEWGNPVEDAAVYAAMKAYSPYDNVRSVDGDDRPVRYPDMLVTAGLEDPRVGFWEPAKWVAKLRAANPQNRVLLKTELGAGHGGPSGRYDAWKDEAFVYAFVLDAVGTTRSAADAVGARPDEEPISPAR